jgi:hypothetical protein
LLCTQPAAGEGCRAEAHLGEGGRREHVQAHVIRANQE